MYQDVSGCIGLPFSSKNQGWYVLIRPDTSWYILIRSFFSFFDISKHVSGRIRTYQDVSGCIGMYRDVSGYHYQQERRQNCNQNCTHDTTTWTGYFCTNKQHSNSKLNRKRSIAERPMGRFNITLQHDNIHYKQTHLKKKTAHKDTPKKEWEKWQGKGNRLTMRGLTQRYKIVYIKICVKKGRNKYKIK